MAPRLVDPDTELRRLRDGPGPGERVRPGDLFVALDVMTVPDATIVAARLREALTAVIEGTEGGISEPEAWERLLPDRLVQGFQSLPTSPVGRWSLSAWVHWYEPKRRE